MLRDILRRTSLYALGDIITKGMNVVLLPIYTAFLDPSAYGIFGIAQVIAMMVPILFTGGIRAAALKFYYHYEGEERRRFYGTIWVFSVVISVTLLLIFEVFGSTLLDNMFGEVAYDPYLRLALWLGVLTAAFVTIPRELFRASGRAGLYSLLQLSLFLFTTVLTLWWVVVERRGAEGALLARVVGTAAVSLTTAIYLLTYCRFKLHPKGLKLALVYSLPMVPHFVAHWVLASTNRIFIERYATLEAAGLFNLAFALANLLQLVSGAAISALMPYFGNLVTGGEQARGELTRSITPYVGLVVFTGLLIGLYAKEAIHILTPAVYDGAIPVVPWLLLGFLAYAFYQISASQLSISAGRSSIIGITTVVAAVSNIGLNILMIPRWGMMGAAGTHALTYIMLMIGTGLFAHHFMPVRYEWRRILPILFSAGCAYAVGTTFTSESVWLSLVTKTLSLLIVPVILVATGVLDLEEIRRNITCTGSKSQP